MSSEKDDKCIISFRVPAEVAEAAKAAARRELITASDVYRLAIARDLRQRGDLKEST